MFSRFGSSFDNRHIALWSYSPYTLLNADFSTDYGDVFGFKLGLVIRPTDPFLCILTFTGGNQQSASMDVIRLCVVGLPLYALVAPPLCIGAPTSQSNMC